MAPPIDEVIVQFKPGLAANQSNTVMAEINAVKLAETSTLGLELWQLDPSNLAGDIASLSDNPWIKYIEPNDTITLNATTPNDPELNRLWGLNNTGQTGGTADADIDAPEAWTIQRESNVVVGVIDSGVDYNHPDLRNNMWTNPGEIPNNGRDDDGNGYVDDYYGYDFVNNDSDPFDDYFAGHGTHVAGTIAAEGNNGIGISGVSWSASLMALKVFDENGIGTIYNAIRAIEYAVQMGADITNNSWGGNEFSQMLYDAIAAAGDADQLFIAAAGNNGRNTDFSPFYPSSYDLDNIISVAATDDQDQRASFSNYGPTSVDLGAPGVGIYSTLPGGGYGFLDGTSMATPHVTGVASLILAQNPNLSALEVKDTILNGVDPAPRLQRITVTGGRLNASTAVNNARLDEPLNLVGANGSDTFEGGNNNDILDGRNGRDYLFGFSGDDTLIGGGGQDLLDGGAGDDSLDGGSAKDRLLGFAGNDTLTGGGGQDLLDGGTGDDLLKGGGGQDQLYGSAGDDTLRGNQAGDILDGGLGDDVLIGGGGQDTFVLAAGNGTDTITDFQLRRDRIGLSGGLGSGDLSFVDNNIVLSSNNQVLATLTGVNTSNLRAAQFVTVEPVSS